MQALQLRNPVITQSIEQKDFTIDNSIYDRKLIAWEKWVCPFGTNMMEQEWPGAYDDEEVAEYNDDVDELEEGVMHDISELGKRTPLIATPFGIIPITEKTNPGKIFNFWDGTTNFKINGAIRDIMDNVSGVESLDIWTHYRFRIGIGKLFHDGKVMNDIDAQVKKYFHNRETRPWDTLKLSGVISRKKAN